MGNSNEFKDVFLKKMFKTSSLDKPSDNFTANLMNRIQTEVVLKKEADKPIIEPIYWLMIGAALIVAAYLLFQMDWSFVSVLMGELNIKPIELPELPELPKISLNIFGSLQESLKAIQVPSVLIIAIVAVGSLITIDRILKSRTNAKLLLF